MNSLLFVFLQAIVLAEFTYAFAIGLGYPGQKHWDKKVLTLIEHWGLLSDLIISYIAALLFQKCASYWSKENWICAIFWGGLVTGGIMVNMWRSNSRGIYDPCGIDGRLTFAGWLHFVYIVITFPIILLFYFATPYEVARPYLVPVTVYLAFHLAVGLLKPEYTVHKKLTWKSMLPTAVCWIALIWRFKIMF